MMYGCDNGGGYPTTRGVGWSKGRKGLLEGGYMAFNDLVHGAEISKTLRVMECKDLLEQRPLLGQRRP